MTATSILAGEFKGRRILTGRGREIRPTASRVRKGIFSTLPTLSGKNVLDLYAGSGCLGFEALSRGAYSVTFVDKNHQAIQILNRNKRLFPEKDVRIVGQDCFRFLMKGKTQFGLILADPPYGNTNLRALADASMSHLKRGGLLVIESSVHEGWSDDRADVRRYGDTQISIFRRE